MSRLISCLVVCFAFCLSAARGQELKVSLLTVGPGEEVYELFGHNAIVFENSGIGDGSPIAFNWGVFDFNQPNFVGRFIMGRMVYSIGAAYERDMVEAYREQKRMVVKAELRVSPEEARRMLEACLINNEKENREYRYDYYRDNCSTRVRDMLDKGTAGRVSGMLKGKPAEGNYRWHTDRLSRTTPWLYVGLHYVLGHPVDVKNDAWEESFLPGKLHERLKAGGMLGEETALVADASGRGLSGPANPPEWKVAFLAAGLALGGLILTLGVSRVKWARRVGLLGAIAWASLCVVGGGISTWGWLFTDHVVSRWNENWLQLSPVSIVVLAGCAVALIGRPAPKWAGKAACLVLGMSVAGVFIKVLPMMRQPNWEIILLALPIHLAIAAALKIREKGVRDGEVVQAKHDA